MTHVKIKMPLILEKSILQYVLKNWKRAQQISLKRYTSSPRNNLLHSQTHNKIQGRATCKKCMSV